LLGWINLRSLSELWVVLSNQVACLRLDDIRCVNMLLTSFGGLAILKHDTITTSSYLVRADVDCRSDQIILIGNGLIHIKLPRLLFHTLILVRSIRAV
jgi:hypothetical protein